VIGVSGAAAQAAVRGHAPVTVLVVDDEPLILMATAASLADAGCRVLEASDADEALAVLEEEPAVDVLVTDVKMPGGMDGFGLARAVAGSRPGIGIVVNSGHATPDESELPEGALFLAKPYRTQQLVLLVNGLAARGSAGA